MEITVLKPLYVIAVVSNPVRYESRYRLYKRFVAHMKECPGVVLIEVEHAYGDRLPEVTNSDNPYHLQLRGGPESELWLKESLINAGVQHLSKLHPEWEYVAWIDADIKFINNDWAVETVHQLQHYKVVQPWSTAIDMGPRQEVMNVATSFCYRQWNNKPNGKGYAEGGHPGYAWALRREVWNSIGGLIDWCAMGAADHHMAWAFAGNINKAIHKGMPDSYRRKASDFQSLCDKYIQKDIGYCEGLIVHEFHGKKRNRFYKERWQALVDTCFDPDTDLTYSENGLISLSGRNIGLRDALRKYFRSRNEDDNSIDSTDCNFM